MLQYLSIGFVLYGIGDFFNRFLLAKGKGKQLRNASFLVGFTLLIGNVIFIYLYGGGGAAFARILSGLMYALVILYYYRKEIKGL
ncbi:polysaccharide biosynthesis C-terminal domain-containing protein [Chryseobacterium sp. W4I1]|uniref:polysaccharide biosynthesis C-terminal domain-containing protein n=1 Tax=Chryseobacterium sp. W4I1 TaxID=3042293 RepID=UPI003593841E